MESTKNNSSTGFLDTWKQPAPLPITLTSEAQVLATDCSSDTVPFYRGANRGLLTNTDTHRT